MAICTNWFVYVDELAGEVISTPPDAIAVIGAIEEGCVTMVVAVVALAV